MQELAHIFQRAEDRFARYQRDLTVNREKMIADAWALQTERVARELPSELRPFLSPLDVHAPPTYNVDNFRLAVPGLPEIRVEADFLFECMMLVYLVPATQGDWARDRLAYQGEDLYLALGFALHASQ